MEHLLDQCKNILEPEEKNDFSLGLIPLAYKRAKRVPILVANGNI